jgi:antagonist of KipI
MSLVVLRPGLHSLLVDHGRPRSRSLGVPVGGAADRAALALGNALVGNAPDAVALEITLAGPVLRATQSVACVIFGAPFEVYTNRRRLVANYTFTLQPDEELHVGGTAQGARAYLCVAGGIFAPLTLGSHSALRPLQGDEILECQAGVTRGRRLALDFAEAGACHLMFQAWPDPLSVIAGPQADWFPTSDEFFNFDPFNPCLFTLSPASNRMGLRLQGPPLPVPPRELVSEPVCPGTVQVTRDGQCIILGVDAQTIGGYPKVAQVISSHLDRLGQLRPGELVAFTRVRLEDAERVYREQQRRLRATCTWLRLGASGL